MMNSLKINRDKTEFIIFGSKPATYKNYSLKIGTTVLCQLQIASLDCTMSLNKHTCICI